CEAIPVYIKAIRAVSTQRSRRTQRKSSFQEETTVPVKVIKPVSRRGAEAAGKCIILFRFNRDLFRS
ncbi:hypothetical protein MUP29_00800, partial [bacterium]|nr:hypothetical protein [bacterium]